MQYADPQCCRGGDFACFWFAGFAGGFALFIVLGIIGVVITLIWQHVYSEVDAWLLLCKEKLNNTKGDN